jgi:hypothetical protein
MSNDDIGYGKPPKKNQFKKGQSGNPNGRPKGSKSLKTVVLKELATKLEIKIQGKVKTVTKLEALVMKLMNDALSGQTNAQMKIVKLADLFSVEEDDQSEKMPASEEDLSLLKRFIAQQAKTGGSE